MLPMTIAAISPPSNTSGVGAAVGLAVGLLVGDAVGLAVGLEVGDAVGLAVGLKVGDAVGLDVGDGVTALATVNTASISKSNFIGVIIIITKD